MGDSPKVAIAPCVRPMACAPVPGPCLPPVRRMGHGAGTAARCRMYGSTSPGAPPERKHGMCRHGLRSPRLSSGGACDGGGTGAAHASAGSGGVAGICHNAPVPVRAADAICPAAAAVVAEQPPPESGITWCGLCQRGALQLFDVSTTPGCKTSGRSSASRSRSPTHIRNTVGRLLFVQRCGSRAQDVFVRPAPQVHRHSLHQS
jgi:hypothetical protein